MRNAFAEEITLLAAEDKRIVMLPADIGNHLFDKYKEQFPDRFYNCGVAEADTISIAAGMAFCGLRPVAYTINSFITTRCFEQIRVDVCCNNLPVIIAGVGGGLSYSSLGVTHHSCEDIAIMRVLPNMTVICPGDAFEVRAAIRAALKHEGPVYIRLGKKGEPLVHKEVPNFKIGKGIVINEGNDICLLSTGNMLPTAMKVAEILKKQGISAQVVSVHTIKPLDKELLSDVFGKFSLVVSVEEHSKLGGLGGSIAEWLADEPSQKARLLRFGTEDVFMQKVGDQEYAREYFGLTQEAITDKILKVYQMNAK